jgi:hypothetical protein
MPTLALTTTSRTRITALLVCECYVDPVGEQLQARIIIDGATISPGEVSLSWVEAPYQTRSLLAVSGILPPGLHKISAEWMITAVSVASSTAYMKRRSLAAWAD